MMKSKNKITMYYKMKLRIQICFSDDQMAILLLKYDKILNKTSLLLLYIKNCQVKNSYLNTPFSV